MRTLRRATGALLLVAASATPAHAHTRRALLVGIDAYVPSGESAAAPGGRPRSAWTDLEGAVNDVEALRAILIARFGFAPSDVHVLVNAQATRERILADTRTWLIETVSPGDVSLFYYAGHGSQVRNSKSRERDGLDESIVPADANAGAADIRDKELAALFDTALDRGAALTAWFDSCHSGSVARGVPRPTRFRVVPPDTRDVADPSDPVAPETRGGLVLSAAQDYQLAAETEDENGHAHGLLTWALMKVLRTMPIDERADRVFLRLRGLMQSADVMQEPVLAATPERRGRTIFGDDSPASLSGRPVVAVQSIDSDGTVLLQGGTAIGLQPGTRLSRVDPGPAVSLEVGDDVALSHARATAAAGSVSDLAPGSLLEVTRWAAARAPALRVWIGGPLPAGDVGAAADAAAPLARTAGVSWIEDPTETGDAAMAVVQHDEQSWTLLTARGTQRIADPSAAVVAPLLQAGVDGRRTVLVNLPPTAEMAAMLQLGTGPGTEGIAVVPSASSADYVLVGRRRAGTIEYAWVRPFVTGAQSGRSAMPPRSDWFALGSDAAATAARLRAKAQRLAVLRGWLMLESPPDGGRFPYHLALRNSATRELLTSGVVRKGERYDLALVASSPAPPARTLDERFVYVFIVDSDGTSKLLYPATGAGNIENHLPSSFDPQGRGPAEIALSGGGRLNVAPPFGTDTYFLLTTAVALPDPSVLEGAGVRSRGANDPLTQLLARVATGRRGGDPTPGDWSIERISFQSVDSPAKHEQP